MIEASPTDPSTPPVPTCSVPATVNPPDNTLFPANVNRPEPVLFNANVPVPPFNAPEKTVSVPSPAVRVIVPPTDEVIVPPCPFKSDRLATV